MTSEAKDQRGPRGSDIQDLQDNSPLAFGGSINIGRFWDRRMEYEEKDLRGPDGSN